MLVKNLVRKNIGAVAGYNSKSVRQGHGQLLYSNVASSAAKDIAQELGAIAALRPRVKQPGVHTVIAMHPDDAPKVANLMLLEIVLEYRRRMNLEDAQTVVWRHTDKPHPHIHILFNRVTPSDAVVSMWNVKRKVDAFSRDMCERFGLKPLLSDEFDAVHPELAQGGGLRNFGI
jgi:Relaxase/Mobilisation nuclease domain